MEQDEFLRVFGDVIRRGRAAVFVGAGVSLNSGFPNWNDLIQPLRETARIPDSVNDPTIAAEYAVQELHMSVVERLLLKELQNVTPRHNDILTELLSINFAEIWTTNFDTLIEELVDDLECIVEEDDYGRPPEHKARRLTKLHGSLSKDNTGKMMWKEYPIIARSHYEQYEQTHPLKWAMLRAQFLTSSFLFLGFSFTDPNVNMLLRIVRSLPPKIRRLPHFAIMRTPDDSNQEREFELFCNDLKDASINVVAVNDYSEIPGLLRALARHSLQPTIFVSGRIEKSSLGEAACTAIGAALTGTKDDLILLSYGGLAAHAVMAAYKTTLPPEKYRPEQVRTYYRRSPVNDEKIEVQRFGTAIFTEKHLPDMRREVFAQIKVLILIGDGIRSHEEAELALELGIPLIPVASTGADPHSFWNHGYEVCGFISPRAAHPWSLLNHTEPSIVADAVRQLLDYVL